LYIDFILGFIDFIVGPSLEVCGDLFDKIHLVTKGVISSASSDDSYDERPGDDRPKTFSNLKHKKNVLSIDSTENALNAR